MRVKGKILTPCSLCYVLTIEHYIILNSLRLSKWEDASKSIRLVL